MRYSTVQILLSIVLALSLFAVAHGGEANMPARRAKESVNVSVHQVSVVDTRDFGSGVLRIGDMNGDGAPDLLVVQSVYATRHITCLTAMTIDGKRLWQTGKPSVSHACAPYSDLPVQVHDWDNDGVNEVLYIRQATYIGGNPKYRERADRYEGNATMVVLNAMDGKEKKTFPLPAPADDSFLFADLTGRGRPQDLVVKDRYWNMWGVSFEGEVLWHWKGSTGHFPAVADVDNDGRDEVYVGYTLIDHDGKVLFNHHPNNTPNPHSDANWIARLPDGAWRLAFGNGGAHLLTPEGKELWRAKMPEAQHVVAGRFRDDSPLQFLALERGMKRTPTDTAKLHLIDVSGKRLWTKALPPGSWATACRETDWSGKGYPGEILVYGFPSHKHYAAIYDGNGNEIDVLSIPWKAPPMKVSGKEVAYSTRADVWGDGRQEVIMFGPAGLCIYANGRATAKPVPKKPLKHRTINETVYTGM
jgi:hypothetical protein